MLNCMLTNGSHGEALSLCYLDCIRERRGNALCGYQSLLTLFNFLVTSVSGRRNSVSRISGAHSTFDACCCPRVKTEGGAQVLVPQGSFFL